VFIQRFIGVSGTTGIELAFAMGGNDSITIVGPPNPLARLTVYSRGTACTVGGNGVINQTS
jgi:hypothetical protein